MLLDKILPIITARSNAAKKYLDAVGMESYTSDEMYYRYLADCTLPAPLLGEPTQQGAAAVVGVSASSGSGTGPGLSLTQGSHTQHSTLVSPLTSMVEILVAAGADPGGRVRSRSVDCSQATSSAGT